MAAVFNVLRSFLNNEVAPDKVIEVKTDNFSSRKIHVREDALVLYLPPDNLGKKDKSTYEIILHRPMTETSHQIFSLYRSNQLEPAEVKFIVYKDKLPTLVEISKDMCHVAGLQKICDTLNEHPTWTLAHLAAYFSLYESFTNTKISNFLNSTDSETGISPLQVAISTGNLKTVQILVNQGCSLEHLDKEGNSVYHYAASSTKEIISALTQGTPPPCLNMRNKNGYTPLHMACLSDNSDCVRALLLIGADVNKTAGNSENDHIEPGYVGNYLQVSRSNVLYQKDMKFGGTPLHWSLSRQVIEALVDMNCHIDSVNFELRTPLHMMVIRNRLDCTVALLSRQANPNLGDCNGDRPIHLAVKEGNLSIIQCLIIFGADLDVLNNAGESPRHLLTNDQEQRLLYYLHAVGAKRCPADMIGCTEGCKFNGSFDGIPPPEVLGPTNREALNQMLSVAAMEAAAAKHPDGKFPQHGRLLALDGGGIRGLILVQMLLELETILNKPIGNCFDWIAGTSTGGILGLAIATGKTMQECLCLYFRLKEQTFVGMRPYSSQALENILKDTFGMETVMSDIKHPKIMITGVLADRKPVDLHLFRNYKSASEILGVSIDSPFKKPPPPSEQFVWEVGRATGAAPTYFRAFGRYLDGGLIANNPTLDALTEIHEHCIALKAVGRDEEAAPVSVVVSLGTGQIPTTQIRETDSFKFESIWDSAKLVMGISGLFGLIVDQATQSDGRVIDRARAWCSTIGVPYFRFSPLMSEEVAMDEKADEKLCKMLWETKAYMRQNTHLMIELADILNRG
ncbi:85/88 kDa calcium-independent phospholipase A2 isoform X2 [Aethina tumida]|uniref:85/88 kDa calcium-independent phospholipase A2 isoform X2 n=1 Tax=Aethina tumida TaxID=116153 RepID=UPI002147552C|nr:85/88 kDa calcium-independent phospholipase A2 isoform X2 [Aethina tumida]